MFAINEIRQRVFELESLNVGGQSFDFSEKKLLVFHSGSYNSVNGFGHLKDILKSSLKRLINRPPH